MTLLAWAVALGAGLGLLLLARAWTRRHVRRARKRHPPTGQTLEIDGVRVHHVSHGDGPLVLCLHGLAGFLEDFTWPGIPQALADRFHVIALDRPGYGFSSCPHPELADVREQADWLAHLVEALGHEETILVGHSLGGGLATAFAVRHPDRVQGLVLLAPYVHPNTEPHDWIHALPRLPGLRSAIARTLVVPGARLLGPSIVGASFEPQPIPADYHELWLDRALDPDHFGTTVEEVRRIDPALAELREGYGSIQAPTSILTGDADRSVDPDANALRLAEEIPGAELTVFEGYGHMVPWTHAQRVVEAVRSVRRRARDAQDRSEA